MANKSKSKTAENYSALYKSSNRQASNRKRKLERQLKLQPNNEQVKLALKNIGYRRRTPTTPTWSASWIRVAKLFKEFGGRFDRDIMSANADVARAALQKQSPKAASFVQGPQDKNPFSLASRVNLNA
jgi:hypothetical protein